MSTRMGSPKVMKEHNIGLDPYLFHKEDGGGTSGEGVMTSSLPILHNICCTTLQNTASQIDF